MVQALVIAVFVVVFVLDASAPVPIHPGWSVVGHGVIGALGWTLSRRAARAVEHGAGLRAARRVERVILVQRLGTVAWHALAVGVFGELEGVRAIVGDQVALDEVVVLVPPLGVIALGFWCEYPLERRLRQTVALDDLAAGRPAVPVPRRAAWAAMNVRVQLLFVALPLAMILGWGELADRISSASGWDPGGVGAAAVQVGGALAVFTLAPWALRRVWRTRPLGAGALRDRLTALARAHRVRFGDLLEWDTLGTQVNGAVLGLVAPARYVLLTDGLLARLSPTQVEAVMAHEVAHLRLRHLAWMAGSLIGCVTLVGTPLGWMAGAGGGGAAVDGVVLVLTLGAAMGVLGFVSRRFEWQADAYAVKHLSGWTPGRPPVEISPEACAVMAGALARVARLNGVSPDRPSWRHGSIRHRQERLRAIIGRRTDRVWADREAFWVRAASLLGLGIGLGLVGLEVVLVAFGRG